MRHRHKKAGPIENIEKEHKKEVFQTGMILRMLVGTLLTRSEKFI